MLGVSGTPVSGAVGKLGDLGDRLSDKIRTLICSDWDPYSMFPFTDGLSCHRVSDLCRPLVIVRFRSIPPLRCDRGMGKPEVFGSRLSQFQVRVKPEQTRTPSQPLPTVYGFFMGHQRVRFGLVFFLFWV